MIVDYSVAVGKYWHEVIEEATVDDIIYYMASKDLQYQEEQRVKRKAAARARR